MAGMVPRVLGANQRRRFSTIKANRGIQAARDYRLGVAQNKGMTVPNRVPNRNPAGGAAGGAAPTFSDPRLQSRYDFLVKQGRLKRAARFAERHPAAAAEEEAAPAPATEAAPADEGMTEDTFRMLFPGQASMENYQESPMYKWQLEQGQLALDRKLAAQGLQGSGAELAAQARMVNELNAQESQRAQAVAEDHANRYERLLQNESLRKERGSNEQWDRLSGLLSLMLSQNPAQMGYDAAGGLANLSTSQAKELANLMAAAYSSGGGGGGGGGGGSLPFILPYPSSPNYSAANIANIWGDAGSGTDWGNVVTSILASIGGGAK
jgi:hypothetical protein